MSESSWTPRTGLAIAVVEAGFKYDPAQDIIYSHFKAWQRAYGFCWAYDLMSARLSMIIDCEIFYFWYENKPWLIELWKGQYGLETGAEIGVYCDLTGTAFSITDPKRRLYRTCQPAVMKFTLKRNGKKLLSREGFHWWLTGFKWGVFTESPETDLVMDLEITCETSDFRDRFNEAVVKRGYPDSKYGQKKLVLSFAKPKTVQPESRTTMKDKVQTRNKDLVDRYNAVKEAMFIPNNDPNEFTEKDLERKISSAAANNIQNHLKKAQENAKNFQHKTSDLVKKIKKEAADDENLEGFQPSTMGGMSLIDPTSLRGALYEDAVKFYKGWENRR